MSERFDLTKFFPYRLAVLAERVSQAVSRVYAEPFDLTLADWRVLAALDADGAMAAKDIAAYSTLDKMQVSRAVARLEERGFVARREDKHDRRAKLLRLTVSGRALMAEIVPRIVEREENVLAELDPAARAALERAMEIVLRRANALVEGEREV